MDTSAEAAEQIPTRPAEVTIELTGLPPRAKITLDGQRISSTFIVPMSSTPVSVAISARGFIALSKSIVPNQNKTIELKMKKKRRRRR